MGPVSAAHHFVVRCALDTDSRMLNFLGSRLLQMVPTLFFVSLLIFSLQHLLPGDPALVMAGEEREPAVIEQIRKQYHLDQSIPVQYAYWVKGVLTGDLGESLRVKVPVRAPERDGEYVLAFDVSHGADDWLSTQPVSRGSRPYLAFVRVTGGRLTFVDLDKLFTLDAISGEDDPAVLDVTVVVVPP